MGNIAALQAIWPTLPGLPTMQKLTILNNKMVPGPPQDISTVVLSDFLTSKNILQSITEYVYKGTNQSALIGCNYLLVLLSGSIIHTSIPTNFAAVQQLGAGLLADPVTGVTQADVIELLSIVAPPTVWWKVNGFEGPISLTELIAAGNLY